MNILCEITWAGSDGAAQAAAFYQHLLDGAARGIAYPVEGPYEVALVQPRKPGGAPAVVILLLNQPLGSTPEPRLMDWFARCGAELPAGDSNGLLEGRPVTHLKVETELGDRYEILANFGTFVGEPDLVRAQADEPAPADPSPAVETPEAAAHAPADPPEIPPAAAPLDPLAAARYALGAAEPLRRVEPRRADMPFDPLEDAAHAVDAAHPIDAAHPADIDWTAKTGPQHVTHPLLSPGCLGCLRYALGGLGVVLILSALAFGILAGLGNYASADPPSMTHAEFAIAMALCPLPVALLGGALITLGALLPRWTKNFKVVH